jgi:SPP1 gp7 family putative phage head morphogenesis protein
MPKPKDPPGPVPREAVEFLKRKKITPGFSFRDVWKEEHDHAFTVAKIMESDILTDVQDSLTKSLEEGVPFRQWAKEIKPRFDASGWSNYGGQATLSRMALIYETNMKQARAVGQWDRIDRTKRFRPFLRYLHTSQENPRLEHQDWDGIILPADDPWWDSHMPINGFRCKCTAIQESRAVVERRGGPTPKAPPLNLEPHRNPKTGKIEQVPKGIDPGFNHNPGKARKQTLAKVERDSKTQQQRSEKSMKKAVK